MKQSMNLHVPQEGSMEWMQTIGGEGDGVSNGDISESDVDKVVIWVKSTNNCFGGLMLIFDLLEALEMEALVDAMDVDNG
ncbi:hypothetical protein Tco_0157076 [Tanacetum coccineum]|uniref:Uncharacterized protein n=1 Tax=Tanacetum coccineum TaxID=301880 RepID=A0ABQ4WUN7_9ASTR